MNTPTTRQLRRPKHVPTPKMSNRKKDLFGSNSKSSSMMLMIDEDSDLGPMNPLDFSSSPKSYDEPLEHRSVRHLCTRRMDFSNLMEQLSPAIKNSCRISHPDDSPKKCKSTSTLIEEGTFTKDSMLEKENCVEELLRTPVVSSNAATVPRCSFRKTHNSAKCSSDGTFSPNSRKAIQRRKFDSKSKNDASTSDSPKAKASLTFAEISAKSFYGTSNIDEPIVKRQPVDRVPISIKASKKRSTSVPNRRHQDRRSIPRRPILGSIRKLNNKFKAKKVKLSVPITKRNLILDEIEKTIDNASLKMYFKDLQSNNFDKQLISGKARNLIEESEKSRVDTITPVALGVSASALSDEEIREGDDEEEKEQEDLKGRKRKFFKSKTPRMQKRYQVTKCLSATVEQGHGIKLLSPPKKKVKRAHEEYDELLLIRNEVLDIVKGLSNDPETFSGYNRPNSAGEVMAPVLSESLCTNDMEISEDISIYEKYHNMIPYNTTDSDEINRQQTVLGLLIESGICNDENFRICITNYEQHKEEAAQILNNLFEISISSNMDEVNDTSTLISQNNVNTNDEAFPVTNASDSVTQDVQNSNKKLEFHPIFYKEFRRSDMKKDLLTVPLPKKLIKWIPISDNQLQIDAGQKEFGTKTCSQCEMVYTVHDPEDEILHQKFHNNMMGVLSFKGWTDENLVENIEEWGNMGRIIWVNQTDIKCRVSRIREVMEIINKDLGFANVNLPHHSIIYLAISRKHIIGVCVAEPLKLAHTMYTDNHIEYIDLKIDIPVKCGISRIWVTPQYRRYGVGTRLIQAVCSHFVRGHNLSVNEIAFSTPTVMGKQFAQKICTNVYVYDQV